MSTNTNKIDYTKLPLSQQLERGLELFDNGEYDLGEMMKEWGQYTHPQISYDPKTDSLVYSYRWGTNPNYVFGTPEQEAQDCWESGSIAHFPLLYLVGWNQGPDEHLLPGDYPLDFWTEDEWTEICEKYDRDWGAWHEDHPEEASFYDRIVDWIVGNYEEDRDSCITMAIEETERAIAHLKELELEGSR
jgi:hypothetical protein